MERRPEPNLPPASRLSRRQFLLRNAGVCGAFALSEGLGERERIEVTRHRVALPGLRGPIRVVQLTDLHRSWCVSEAFIARVVQKTNALRPDLVALTGDFITRSSHYAGSCADRLRELQAPLGLFGVLGNHDYWCDHNRGARAVMKTLEQAGVRMLVNTSAPLEHGLFLAGVDDSTGGHPDLRATFEAIPPGSPTLTLIHNPYLFRKLSRWRCVTLAGHTHGGQIAVPFIWEQRLQWVKGWHRLPKQPGRLYVSRGLGTVGLPLRIGSLPEIALFDLLPA